MFANNGNLMARKSAIFDFLKKIEQETAAYEVLYLGVSKLQNPNLKASEKSQLRDVFISRGAEIKTIELYNNDLLFFYSKKLHDEMLSCLVKARFLLQGDEVVGSVDDLISAKIAEFYDISTQRAEFEYMLEKNFEQQQKLFSAEKQVDTAIYTTSRKNRDTKKPLTPKVLAKIKKILSVADFSSFIRRQAVCAIIGKAAPQRVFDEVYVSIPDLREMLLPDVDLTSNLWLFLSLSETLDKGVMDIISRHDDGSLMGNFSININVSTILSDEFFAFDDSINVSMRSSIVLELQLSDIFSDINAFMLAKAFVRARGYKICVDGVTVDKLQYINREHLDYDFIKIIWHSSFKDIISKDEHFMDYANKNERAKIILCRIDDPEAIKVGNSFGINLYQGRYIQKCLSQQTDKFMSKK